MLPVLLFMNKYCQNNFFTYRKIIFHSGIQQCLYTVLSCRDWQILRYFKQSILEQCMHVFMKFLQALINCNFKISILVIYILRVKNQEILSNHNFLICVCSSHTCIIILSPNKVRKIESQC